MNYRGSICLYMGRMTVWQAIRELREPHLVETVTGKGTYVL